MSTLRRRHRDLWLHVVAGLGLGLGASTCMDAGAGIEGEPCSVEEDACLDSDTLQACRDGTWRLESCKETCGDQGGKARGCIDRAGDDVCNCDAEADCELGNAHQCTSSGEMLYCFADGLASVPCHALCSDDSPVPAGCYHDLGSDTESCNCVPEGSPCTDGDAPQCSSNDELARCVGGIWTISDCATECGSPEATCGHDALLDAGSCRC